MIGLTEKGDMFWGLEGGGGGKDGMGQIRVKQVGINWRNYSQ